MLLAFFVLFMLMIGFSLIFFLITYMAYPSLKRFVIDPYYEENKHETAEGMVAAEAKEEMNADQEYKAEDDTPEYVYHNGRMVHRSVFENENLFDDEVK